MSTICEYSIEYSVDEKEFSIDEINAAINANPNLIPDEKMLFSAYNSFLEDNSQYIDMNVLVPKLKNFSIDYTSETNNSAAATCNISDTLITVYGATDFYNTLPGVLLHEYGHVVSPQYTFLGTGLDEAVTETIKNEICYDNFGNYQTYHFECCYLKILCETIGAEVFKEYHLTGNIFCVIEELKKIIPDEELAIKLISDIDSITIYNKKLNKDLIFLERKEIEQNIEYCKSEVENSLNRYFCAAKGYDMREDAIVRLYMREYGVEDSNSNEVIALLPNVSTNTSVPLPVLHVNKGYFIKEHIDRYSEATIRTDTFEEIQHGEIPPYCDPNMIINVKRNDNTEVSIFEVTKEIVINENNRHMQPLGSYSNMGIRETPAKNKSI